MRKSSPLLRNHAWQDDAPGIWGCCSSHFAQNLPLGRERWRLAILYRNISQRKQSLDKLWVRLSEVWPFPLCSEEKSASKNSKPWRRPSTRLRPLLCWCLPLDTARQRNHHPVVLGSEIPCQICDIPGRRRKLGRCITALDIFFRNPCPHILISFYHPLLGESWRHQLPWFRLRWIVSVAW